ncbi:hypothetical protein HispidOSU_030659 [Sigmodon hispidus]
MTSSSSKAQLGHWGTKLWVFNGAQLRLAEEREACKLQNRPHQCRPPRQNDSRDSKLCLIKSENSVQMNFSRIMPPLALQYYTHARSRSLTGTYFVVNLHKGLRERAQACHTHVI